MTLEPQKAQNQRSKQAKGGEKRTRRKASEYTLVWSDEAQKIARGCSRTEIERIKDAAYERIWFAETVLCGTLSIVTIVPMPPVSSFDKWWTPFLVGDLWFVLRYEDTHIREYHLYPADGPAPGDGGDPPAMTRRQKTPPPAEIAPRSRAGKKRQTKGARPAAVKRPPKQTDAERVFFMLYDLINYYACRAWHDCGRIWMRAPRQIAPRLARIVDAMTRVGGNMLDAIQDCHATLVQMLRDYVSLTIRISASFTETREVAAERFGPSASLEPRCVAQNSGLGIRINSWVWDNDPPVDWAAYPFGRPPEQQASV
jgi:hypothetical protein